MKKLFESAIQALTENQSFVMVSVLTSSGSTPRSAGAIMLVFEDDHTEGTIGGGRAEYEAQLHAVSLLKTGSCDTVRYTLNTDEIKNLGMICGGDITVHFQFIKGESFLPLFRHLVSLYTKNKNSWFIRRIRNNEVVSVSIYENAVPAFGEEIEGCLLTQLLKNTPVYLPGSTAYFAEPILQAGYVYVFGGGHVSQTLVPVLARLGFRIVVYEDREAFATKELFPDAEKIILGDFTKLKASITLTPYDYAIIVTRGHQADYEVLSQVLAGPFFYLGCIGSRKKIALTKERLRNQGFTEKALDAMHSPIGLPIKAETPAEIAISIAGELIQYRAEHSIGNPT